MPWTVVGNIRGPQGAQGNPGPKGDPGDPGPVGPATLEPQGPWSAVTTYAQGDVVTWGGSSYYALASPPAAGVPPTGTAGDPGTVDTATNAGWAYLAVQGAQGPQGEQGQQGLQGNPGTAGSPGVTGPRGSKWFFGTGAPGVIADSLPGDVYLDQATGDTYNLT